MKEEILRCLSEAEGYISGQMLCEQFGVSRTAVWKVIKQLKDEGYEIEAVNNRGYKLHSHPDVITPPEIMTGLLSQWAGCHLVYHEVVGSTNTAARKAAEEGAPHGTLALAEIQESGRGRLGRPWCSPKGSGIWMSMVLRPKIMPMQASMLTIVAAMAVYDALSSRVEGCQIKWPNDIIIHGKKVCGILTEMSAEMEGIHFVICGIGINVNTPAFDETVASVATSMFLESGIHFKRSDIICDFCAAFEKYYALFMEQRDLSAIMTEYNNRLVNVNRQVSLIKMGETQQGIARGMDKDGCLMVEIDGEMQHVNSGEVSVRGILGYV